jgi:hypothetical protein
MALPSSYLITPRNIEPLFNALRTAKAPEKFTQRFLESLDFKSTNDRLFINVFKALGLLTEDGSPTSRYYEFMDQRQSARVLAEALEEAYADLFQIRRDAQNMTRDEVKGKIKTLTQGQYSDNVVDKMALTFLGLATFADFSAPRHDRPDADDDAAAGGSEGSGEPDKAELVTGHAPDLSEPPPAGAVRLGGFVYNIELHLPESRDPAVYEALFRSLKTHLLS